MVNYLNGFQSSQDYVFTILIFFMNNNYYSTPQQITRVLAEQGRTKSCQIVVFGSSDPESFKNFRRQEPDPSYQATRIDNPRRAVAFILLTQGTQGVPKMVCVSHTCIYRLSSSLILVSFFFCLPQT